MRALHCGTVPTINYLPVVYATTKAKTNMRCFKRQVRLTYSVFRTSDSEYTALHMRTACSRTRLLMAWPLNWSGGP